MLIHIVGRRAEVAGAEVADLKTDIHVHKALEVFMLLIMFYMCWALEKAVAALEQAVAAAAARPEE
ncbi:hypothetical protein IMZ48_03740 [Candidatus Bathyarchaeota archaeon]|nr:hypothetical protein [Candidatus Bathyarchaeota archaeon]